ncbi:hypothetical protein IQ07DRAFT_644756 [Pyrenochaeta sp. DS3sAY3a]|nr:hypothetical protein IQ07DRAFT_644756 [Pyrenochaeta sp. DS3sAY3a]
MQYPLAEKDNQIFQAAGEGHIVKEVSREHSVYRSATTIYSPLPITGLTEIIVGLSPRKTRTWFLPKSSVARHSSFFADLIQAPDGSDGVVRLHFEPHVFQNFVDYMHSSIYSLNTQVTGFRAIHHHTQACLLGIKLECKAYQDAAIRQLYMMFEPLARLPSSRAALSIIRASDVDYVCKNTAPQTGLRYLFFNAVAAHWARLDAICIGDEYLERPGDTTTWGDVYKQNFDFHATIVGSIQYPGLWRGAFLRPMEKYVNATEDLTVAPRVEHMQEAKLVLQERVRNKQKSGSSSIKKSVPKPKKVHKKVILKEIRDRRESEESDDETENEVDSYESVGEPFEQVMEMEIDECSFDVNKNKVDVSEGVSELYDMEMDMDIDEPSNDDQKENGFEIVMTETSIGEIEMFRKLVALR